MKLMQWDQRHEATTGINDSDRELEIVYMKINNKIKLNGRCNGINCFEIDEMEIINLI